MSGFELVAGVIGIFFAAGIVMGFLIVGVLPRLRGRRDIHGADWREPRYRNDERPPRWPGG